MNKTWHTGSAAVYAIVVILIGGCVGERTSTGTTVDPAAFGSFRSGGAAAEMLTWEEFSDPDKAARNRVWEPDIVTAVPMRDGVTLHTEVALPDGEGPFPTILLRSPYYREIIDWANYKTDRYRLSGYVVAFQTSRGTGASEGRFRFFTPDREDGYDTIEWIAQQPWSDGNVGMDGGSYYGSTQLLAASEQPPHLKAIAPAAVTVHPFLETPYNGGVFMRYHMLNWLKLISSRSWEELGVGFMNTEAALADPEWRRPLTMRPIIDAAEGFLSGDRLQQYLDFVSHPVLDSWWDGIFLRPRDYERIDVPMLMVDGGYNGGIGAMWAWRQLEEHASGLEHRFLLIGPWDHGQTYYGGLRPQGAFTAGENAFIDLPGVRLAFFDHYLKGENNGPFLPGRISLYTTGSNEWMVFDRYPAFETTRTPLYLGGSKRLTWDAGALSASAYRVISDPDKPVRVSMQGLTTASTALISVRGDGSDILELVSEPIEEPITVIGPIVVVLTVASDTPDADLFVGVGEILSDGATQHHASGALRLRYREGFDKQVPLTPNEPVTVTLETSNVVHTFQAGSRVRITITGSAFPMGVNPNTGEPIATGVDTRVALLSIFYGGEGMSRLELPVVRR